MKTIFNSCLMMLFLIFSSYAFAGEPATIHLTDGSVLAGEIISSSSGIYSIKTESMGLLKISKSKISSISFGTKAETSPSVSGNTGGSGNSDLMQQASVLSKTMMADEKMMKTIMGLQDNPDFKAALNDPAIMNAISTGNIEALMSNPKFLKLMNNSDVKNIHRRFAD